MPLDAGQAQSKLAENATADGALALLTTFCMQELSDEPSEAVAEFVAAGQRQSSVRVKHEEVPCVLKGTSRPLWHSSRSNRKCRRFPRTSDRWRHTHVTEPLGHPLHHQPSMRSHTLPSLSAHHDHLATHSSQPVPIVHSSNAPAVHALPQASAPAPPAPAAPSNAPPVPPNALGSHETGSPVKAQVHDCSASTGFTASSALPPLEFFNPCPSGVGMLRQYAPSEQQQKKEIHDDDNSASLLHRLPHLHHHHHHHHGDVDNGADRESIDLDEDGSEEGSSDRDGGGRRKRSRRGSPDGRKKIKKTSKQQMWSRQEDVELVAAVENFGEGQWARVAECIGRGRSGKQCRDRWLNKMSSSLNRKSVWSEEEERKLVEAHKELGNKWAEIARRLGNKTENGVKNKWFSEIRRNQIPPPDHFGPLRTYLATLGLVRSPEPVGAPDENEHEDPSQIIGNAAQSRVRNLRGADKLLVYEHSVEPPSVVSSVCPTMQSVGGEVNLMSGCAPVASAVSEGMILSDGIKGRLDSACKAVRKMYDDETAHSMHIAVAIGQALQMFSENSTPQMRYASYAVAVWTPTIGGAAPAAHNLVARVKKQLR